jgi:hypothetical protein
MNNHDTEQLHYSPLKKLCTIELARDKDLGC